jgi:hypothetical protein
MATPAKRPEASKAEILEAYTRLKTKIKKSNDLAKREGEAMMRDFITIGSGAGMGYYMAMLESKGQSTQILDGIDTDMVISAGALAAGMFKWGGNMSDTLRAVGVGGLTQWAARLAASKV